MGPRTVRKAAGFKVKKLLFIQSSNGGSMRCFDIVGKNFEIGLAICVSMFAQTEIIIKLISLCFLSLGVNIECAFNTRAGPML